MAFYTGHAVIGHCRPSPLDPKVHPPASITAKPHQPARELGLRVHVAPVTDAFAIPASTLQYNSAMACRVATLAVLLLATGLLVVRGSEEEAHSAVKVLTASTFEDEVRCHGDELWEQSGMPAGRSFRAASP
jgi:hypothetical protein